MSLNILNEKGTWNLYITLHLHYIRALEHYGLVHHKFSTAYIGIKFYTIGLACNGTNTSIDNLQKATEKNNKIKKINNKK